MRLLSPIRHQRSNFGMKPEMVQLLVDAQVRGLRMR
jgi:hypothetical protein